MHTCFWWKFSVKWCSEEMQCAGLKKIEKAPLYNMILFLIFLSLHNELQSKKPKIKALIYWLSWDTSYITTDHFKDFEAAILRFFFSKSSKCANLTRGQWFNDPLFDRWQQTQHIRHTEDLKKSIQVWCVLLNCYKIYIIYCC